MRCSRKQTYLHILTLQLQFSIPDAPKFFVRGRGEYDNPRQSSQEPRSLLSATAYFRQSSQAPAYSSPQLPSTALCCVPSTGEGEGENKHSWLLFKLFLKLWKLFSLVVSTHVLFFESPDPSREVRDVVSCNLVRFRSKSDRVRPNKAEKHVLNKQLRMVFDVLA